MAHTSFIQFDQTFDVDLTAFTWGQINSDWSKDDSLEVFAGCHIVIVVAGTPCVLNGQINIEFFCDAQDGQHIELLTVHLHRDFPFEHPAQIFHSLVVCDLFSLFLLA